MRRFAECFHRGSIIAALFALAFASPAASKPKTAGFPPTYRNYNESYNKVWNAAVRLLFEDLKYVPMAADSDAGFMSTRPKTVKGSDTEKDRRIRVNVNIKKAAAGTLVTVGCEIEEYTPIKGTNQGRWMQIPSDHSCESQILDRLEAKLKK